MIINKKNCEKLGYVWSEADKRYRKGNYYTDGEQTMGFFDWKKWADERYMVVENVKDITGEYVIYSVLYPSKEKIFLSPAKNT